MNQLTVLDLFAGIGGFSLGLHRAGMRTIAFCEIEPFCQQVLKKHWPAVPIFNDVRTLTANDLPEKPDVICGGYPCQPFSVAGKQRGQEDDRHLWPEMFRIIREVQPSWVIAENVAGHVNMGLDEVLFDLESEGYETQSFVIPACSLNASHRRDRVWIVAYANLSGSRGNEPRNTHGQERSCAEKRGAGLQQENRQACSDDAGQGSEPVGDSEHNGSPALEKPGKFEKASSYNEEGEVLACESSGASSSGSGGCLEDVGYSESIGTQGRRAGGQQKSHAPVKQGLPMRPSEGFEFPYWEAEPGVDRVVDGVPDRAYRIKALGNSVVPQIPEVIGRAILSTYK